VSRKTYYAGVNLIAFVQETREYLRRTIKVEDALFDIQISYERERG